MIQLCESWFPQILLINMKIYSYILNYVHSWQRISSNSKNTSEKNCHFNLNNKFIYFIYVIYSHFFKLIVKFVFYYMILTYFHGQFDQNVRIYQRAFDMPKVILAQ